MLELLILYWWIFPTAGIVGLLFYFMGWNLIGLLFEILLSGVSSSSGDSGFDGGSSGGGGSDSDF